MTGLAGKRWWLACGFVLAASLAATVPTTGDIGLTWDEPAYRYSQLLSEQWWERWGHVHSWPDIAAQLEPDTLLYYWHYARSGINYHPPLAGQLNLLTYEIFGHWMKDIPARRMASVLEYAGTITILFSFLASRYGGWVGAVAGASLLFMPRVYGDGHIAGTDTPGLLLWAATTVAFWKGLHEPCAGRWRVLVGVLLGLAFIEKMSAVFVLVPLLAWLVLGHLFKSLDLRTSWPTWVDGICTSVALLLPLGIAFREILRLAHLLPMPSYTNLFIHRPPSSIPGAILLVPLALWCIRRVLGRVARGSPIWGVERPALEIWTAILAFAPAVGWLGNPAWWREALPRLAHYYMLSVGRRGSMPNIQILYFGQTYEYSLPWHNAWVLIAITVPASILFTSCVGLLFAIVRITRDRLPLYFLVHLVTLPVFRMLPTPAHDGVRLFLPTFFFVAALAGWGTIWLADGLARAAPRRTNWLRGALAALVLVPAAWQLIKIHPFELSYYNELIGGPKGAWKKGFELAYWYDAFNDQTLAGLNAKFPRGATVDFSSELSAAVMVFQDLKSLGKLRGDILLGARSRDEFPYMWLLTQDSKATALSRLLFAMHPWYELRPKQLDHLRVAMVADPVAVSRAWALQLLTDAPDTSPPEPPRAPEWIRAHAPWLARLWGDGLIKVRHLRINESILEWAHDDPEGLRSAAATIAERRPIDDDRQARRLMDVLKRYDDPAQGRRFSETLLRSRPEAVRDAVEILIRRPEDVRAVVLRYSYTDPSWIGGDLDRDLPHGPDRKPSSD